MMEAVEVAGCGMIGERVRLVLLREAPKDVGRKGGNGVQLGDKSAVRLFESSDGRRLYIRRRFSKQKNIRRWYAVEFESLW